MRYRQKDIAKISAIGGNYSIVARLLQWHELSIILLLNSTVLKKRGVCGGVLILLQCWKMKRALITGITGQDGSYLAELLLAKGYEVHGVVRRASSFNRERIDHLCLNSDIYEKKFFLHYGDMTDSSRLTNLVYDLKPEEL